MNDAWFFTISMDKFVKGNIKQTMYLLQNLNYQNNVSTPEKSGTAKANITHSVMLSTLDAE